MILYPSTSFNTILNLTSNFFYTNTDKRTQIITTAGGSPLGNTALLLFFHDAADKPDSLAPFEAVPHLLSTVRTQSFLKFVKGIPAEVAQVANPRGAFATVSTSEITEGFVRAVGEECEVCILQKYLYRTLWMEIFPLILLVLILMMLCYGTNDV